MLSYDDLQLDISNLVDSPPGGVGGLFPRVVNLASRSIITANSTCGQREAETYCRLNHPGRGREEQCGVCDARSPDPTRRHPILRVVDGTGAWWQSESLARGDQLHYVTIDIDLQQYSPWQYYAVSDRDCHDSYGVAPTPGRPRYTHDTEVICTSYFSRLTPFEGGEVHTSLINGRPGAGGPTEALQQFTAARYVRLRFQRLQALQGELGGRARYRDPAVARKYFYSLKDISIGGRCVCHGHADSCEVDSGQQRCSCQHNTCGSQCDRCCPMYNQLPWRPGTYLDAAECQPCECHGHATQCRYDPQVDADALSLNKRGEFIGGGVCVNCQHNTEGINCDRCIAGFYRPQGMSPSAAQPCEPCGCGGPGVTGECVRDDTRINLGIFPGACICRPGFQGPRCDHCSPGYRNYPACEACPCNRAGSLSDACEGDCRCKENVRGERCDVCREGTFSLDEYNPLGCTECFCNGATDICEAAKLPVYTVVEHGNWKVSDLLGRRVIAAAQEGSDAKIAHDDMSKFNSYYFVAPQHYLGSRLTSYGQSLSVRLTWVKLRGDTSGWALHGPDIILEGGGYRIAKGYGTHKGRNNARINIRLHEHGWHHFPKDVSDLPQHMNPQDYQLGQVTRAEMAQVLSSLSKLMIRARYHTVQVESILHGVALEYGKEGASTTTLVTGAVERCICPPGYEGLSCESCSRGYRRVNNTLVGGVCEKCDCNGHALSCDPYTGHCGECMHYTTGPSCSQCLPGYYGDPTTGDPEACQPCSCPLPVASNHFTPVCSDEGIAYGGREKFICDCPVGYEGLQCERCADGFFGSPMIPGNYCQPCDCSNNVNAVERGVCDPISGRCLKCLGNTAGWRCEKCKDNHFGDPLSPGPWGRTATPQRGSASVALCMWGVSVTAVRTDTAMCRPGARRVDAPSVVPTAKCVILLRGSAAVSLVRYQTYNLLRGSAAVWAGRPAVTAWRTTTATSPTAAMLAICAYVGLRTMRLLSRRLDSDVCAGSGAAALPGTVHSRALVQ
ncbi:Laminin IV [Trinorchestia longiramus]|nr:Laminin IV [Trinorchestia longiramus]